MKRSTMGRAFQTFQGQGPTGPRALVAAIIGRAAVDLADGDKTAATAAAFFLSDDYRHMMESIGLSPDWLPAGVTRADLLKLAGARPRPGRPRECPKMSHIATD